MIHAVRRPQDRPDILKRREAFERRLDPKCLVFVDET
jgi:hypothetical protein